MELTKVTASAVISVTFLSDSYRFIMSAHILALAAPILVDVDSHHVVFDDW